MVRASACVGGDYTYYTSMLRADCMRCRKQSCGRGNDDDGGSGKSGDVVTVVILH